MSFNRRKFEAAWHDGKSLIKANCWRDERGVVYHKTRIVEFTVTGARLWSGGWRTSTTKEHMNMVLSMMGIGAYIYQKNFDWFITRGSETVPFEEGMEVYNV